MLDKRLELCAELVGGEGVVCDVGTDHGYLAVELIKSGKCSKVIASDINQGPLESARKTVEKYGLSDKIELVLSDGLENISLDDVSDIVIAGMGGETIVHILESIDFYGIRLILQPMTKPEILREWLCHRMQREDITEKAVEDGDRIYTVICADMAYDQRSGVPSEYEALAGFFDDIDETVVKYRRKQSERFEKKAVSLEKSGRINDAVHCRALSRKLAEGEGSEYIRDIYNFLDEKFPFSLQEKWDNSGLLVDNVFAGTSKIMLTLDITNDVIMEANDKNARLIISHHPVIFNPLKKIDSNSPVFNLIQCGMSAICMHTNLDIAEGGTNTTIVKKLAEKFRIASTEPFEDSGLGYIVEFEDLIDTDDFSAILKEIFINEHIRVSRNQPGSILRVAICSGSGGSLFRLAKEKDCDVLITGDVKHDVWIDAENSYITIFDCGHFHTENIVLWELRRVLEEKFPLLDIEIAERSVAPFEYI
ncbi:MAG: Nif3-like dinuclear metal center hexameric protein [Ruminococcus flavefaciens]|nr:Nif3-like dinuclear metal center hexameric protein [Ruminococcus flavefaciens]MCM1229078.1 Nif3-like dinuclear metal center hexameric protein [Ruminococcus flavefaciens]